MISQVCGIDVFNQYIDDVLNERIVVGSYVRKAVERHVADLEKAKGGWDYYFDESKVDLVVRMFPLVFAHTAGTQHAGKPFHLEPWQAFIIGSLYGWRRTEKVKRGDGSEFNPRRFRVCYVTLGRKNGKSTLAAALGILFGGFDGEDQAQVYIGATRRDQAKMIFEEATRMCTQCERLQKIADVRVSQINFPDASYMRLVPSNKGLSGPNPSCVLFDELHEWTETHRPFYDTLTTGHVARQQPLRFTITTAGDNHSYIWKEEDSYAAEVVSGSLEDDSYFSFIARLDSGDDIFDERMWPKSMPNLGVSINADQIREEANRFGNTPQGRNRFSRYYANVEVSATEQAIDPAEWDACQVKELSNWKTAEAITAAIDAGGVNDLMALAFVARFKDGVEQNGKPKYRYEIKSKCYIDSDTSRDIRQQPFAGWIQTEKIIKTPNLYATVRNDLVKMMREFGGKQIGFDPWNMIQMGEELMSDGFQSVKINQSRSILHHPTAMLLELIRKRRITHDGTQPVFRWALGNLVLNVDNNDRWMPDKKNSGDKIDPVVSAIMALRLASLAPSKPRGSLFVS